MSQKATFGIFRTRAQVESAVGELRHNDFRKEDISVLFPDNEGTKEFAHEKNTKLPEGAAAGAATGAAVGGTLGYLVGIGALAIPGAGPFIAAGPAMALLSGLGLGSAVGSLTGALIGIGIPEYEAKRYEGLLKSGNILLSVHTDDADWAKLAKAILERNGADDIGTSAEAKGDFANSERPLPRPGM